MGRRIPSFRTALVMEEREGSHFAMHLINQTEKEV
jgi:hypothetical protein